MRILNGLPTACQKTEPLPNKLSQKTFNDRVARQDSRHRSPEKGRDAEYTNSSEIGTLKSDRLCYQNAWWTFAKENPGGKMLPWWSEEAMQGHPEDLNLLTKSWEQIAQDQAKWRGLLRRGAGEYEAKRTSKTDQKCASWKARAKASPTELSSSDLSCSICNRQFRAKIGLISHLRTHK